MTQLQKEAYLFLCFMVGVGIDGGGGGDSVCTFDWFCFYFVFNPLRHSTGLLQYEEFSFIVRKMQSYKCNC